MLWPTKERISSSMRPHLLYAVCNTFYGQWSSVSILQGSAYSSWNNFWLENFGLCAWGNDALQNKTGIVHTFAYLIDWFWYLFVLPKSNTFCNFICSGRHIHYWPKLISHLLWTDISDCFLQKYNKKLCIMIMKSSHPNKKLFEMTYFS